ncbi:MAG: hypothetical protein QG570_412 [Patescibacteria group bacterium]|nr:hypothetical protein [Patescibacteria group bacterium]
MQNLLNIGHITLDTFLTIDSGNVLCDVNDRECKIAFEYGAKIPVHEIHYGIGGGASNVVVGTKLLGINSSIWSIIGKDRNADSILDLFTKHKIKTDLIERDEIPTDLATILTFGPERTIFTYNSDRKFRVQPNLFSKFNNVFLSSVGKDVENMYDEIEKAKDKYGFKLFFNPGSKEIRYSHSSIVKILDSVDYLIANIEEGCALLNPGLTRSQIEIEDLISMLNQKGIKQIVLTDGVNGVYYSDSYRVKHVPAEKVEVIEKTGAGDAFASGYISAILHGLSIEDSIKWGVTNGASVVQKVGAQAGLLSQKEMQNKLNFL